MFLKKVCIFLAAAFILADLFLLVLYLEARHNLTEIPHEMIDNTISYYKANGVEIDRDVIVDKIPDNAIYTFKSKNEELADDAANAILKNCFSGKEKLDFVETPEGTFYTLMSDSEVLASFRVYNDQWRFDYSVGTFSPDVLAENHREYFLNDDCVISADAKRQISDVIKSISKDKKAGFTVLGTKKDLKYTYVCIGQNLNENYSIKDMCAVAVFENNKLIHICGEFIFSDWKKNYREELADGVNALLTGIETENVSRFVSQEIVYMVRKTGSDTNYLIPSWKIAYIDVDGNEKIQYVDAIK